MKLAVLVLSALITIAASAPLDDEEIPKQEINYRLPTTIYPSHYELEVTPYFVAETGKPQFSFDGKVSITLSTLQPNITKIVLHAQNLDIDKTVTKLNEAIDTTRTIVIENYEQDEVTNKLTLTLRSPLIRNLNYILYFQYVGQLESDMKGFYRSSYVVNGTTKWLATTQMQPVYARRVFPCFDEPSFKATFVVTVNRPASYRETLSNTQISKTENVPNNRIRETFDKTPIMSTYLLAFIVSEFRMRESVDKTFGVLARPEAYLQTEYAHRIGPIILGKLDEFTGYKYASVPGIKKMHMAALPDFNAGAMENWGLLTYRETALLYDPDVSTALAQQRVASVIAHEQAHMWFGDLVTCDWWKYTWLNEGFARYFQYFITAMVETTWDLPYQFVVEQIQAVLVADSLETTFPMTNDVNSPAEIGEIFGSISYNKGASIIRMIEHLIGSNNFKLALQDYLKLHAFETSTPEKLYTALQKRAGENIYVAAVMNTWTTQSGYPVVTVERKSDRKNVMITQQRFLLRNRTHNDNTLWEIPLNYASPDDDSKFSSTKTLFMLSRTQKSMKLELKNATDWLIFNVQQTGYYRVNYDTDTWKNIGKALKNKTHSGIHLLNRAQIIDDSLNLARAEYIDYKLALSIIQYLEIEKHYIPWLSAFNNMQYIVRRFNVEELTEFKKYILNLTDNIYKELGFNQKQTDTRLDIYNRANVLNYACKYGHAECIKTATQEFDKLETTNYKVPVNVRPVVYCTAISEGGNGEWTSLWNRFKAENVAAEQIVILTALGCTKDANILRKYMDNILTNDVRLQDKSAAFTATFSGQEANVQVVFDYVIANFTNIKEAFGDISGVSTILSNVAARFTTEEQITKLETFYNQNKAAFGTSQTIPNAIEDAKYNLKWADKHVPVIVDYFKSLNGSSRAASVSIVLIVAAILTYFV